MKVRLLIIPILLCCFAITATAQDDSEFYTVKEKNLQKKRVNDTGLTELAVGTFYGSRTFYFEDKNSKEKIHMDMKGMAGLSMSLENSWLIGEAKVGFGDHKTMFGGRGFFTLLPLDWKTRFRVLPYIGGGYSAMIVKGDSEIKLLGTVDLGLKLKFKYYVKDNIAIYAGGYMALLFGGKSTYRNKEMRSFGGQIDGELGVSFVL